MATFDPQSFADIQTVLGGPQSAYFRMVVSYWDMAASFVVNGAIDAKMFNDATGEHVVAFAKIEPFLAEYRQMMGNPNYLKNLETVCVNGPGGLERVHAMRERMRRMTAARAAAKS